MRYPFDGWHKDQQGKVISGGAVAVTLTGTTTAATVYKAETGSEEYTGGIITTNTTDNIGYFKGWLDTDDYSSSFHQRFRLTFTKENFKTLTLDDEIIFPHLLWRYFADASETDQGLAGNGETLKSHIDTITGGNGDTIVLVPGTYTLTTSETIEKDVTLYFQDGAVINGTGTLSIEGRIIANPGQQIFGPSLTVQIGTGFDPYTGLGGNINEIYPNWWGMTTQASPGTWDSTEADTNQSAFNSCLKVAIESGIDLVIPTGYYSMKPVSYTATVAKEYGGTTIRGASGGASRTGSKSPLTLDFSGITNTEVGIKIDAGTATTILNNISFESIALNGPSKATGSSIGIQVVNNFSTSRITSSRFKNVNCANFYTGCSIEGQDNWNLYGEQCAFISCHTGLNLAHSTHGMWVNIDVSTTTTGIVVNGCLDQIFISPLLQTDAGGQCVVFPNYVNGVGRDSTGITFLNPYIENYQDGFLFGYDEDGAIQDPIGNTTRNFTLINGQYSGIGSGNSLIKARPDKLDTVSLINVNPGSGSDEIESFKIINITAATPPVVTTDRAHGFSEDDSLYITGVGGMTTLNNNIYRVNNPSGNTFNLHDEDDVAYVGAGLPAYTSGTGQVTHCDFWFGSMTSVFKTPSGSGDRFDFGNSSGEIGHLQSQTGGEVMHWGIRNLGITRSDPIEFTSGDATPSVAYGTVFKTAGSTTITDFDNASEGQIIYVHCPATGITIQDGAPIRLNGGVDYVMTARDMLILVSYSGVWYESGRSAN